MYDLGDEVYVSLGSQIVTGRIRTFVTVYRNGVYEAEYGIELASSGQIEYFPENKILSLPKRKPKECDCGAETAHYPAPPPGHAHWCKTQESWYV